MLWMHGGRIDGVFRDVGERRQAIEEAVTALGGGADPEQLGLPMPADGGEAAPRSRGGRPPGARNRRTVEMVEFCERVLGEPLLAKAFRIVGADTKALAKGLSCSKLDAFRLQTQVLLGALPYAHQRLPLAVDVQARLAVPLAIHMGVAEAGEGLPEMVERAATVLDLLPEEGEEYQQLSDAESERV